MKTKNTGTGNHSTRVLLVDDHSIVREGLKNLIERENDIMICGQATSGPEALEMIKPIRPHLVILDLGLPGMNGMELIKNLKLREEKLLILVLSMQDEMVYAERCLRAGARGYLMKSESAKKIVPAIRQVLSGKIYLADKVSERVLEQLTEGFHVRNKPPIESLSDRELEVFQWIGKGIKVGKIAKELNLSVKTIEYYRDRIKIKLNLESAQDLTQYAIAWNRFRRES